MSKGFSWRLSSFPEGAGLPGPAFSRVNPLLQGRVNPVGAGLPAKRPACLTAEPRPPCPAH
ncbi:hypothetical protein AL532_22590 [Pseudomonas monteilii]|uniref:Uncharacterized protein n=1 Tax=Pseudomonas monteilii TaxID=76759 RepID=A0A7X3EYG9_9PSED|nr:hypothetical protein AL532_22590 [Pseudomonas monteilii]MVF47814.1 hypothetical protein [Pseudomonas monteilii]